MNKIKNKADNNVLLICSDVQVDKCKGTIRKKNVCGGVKFTENRRKSHKIQLHLTL